MIGNEHEWQSLYETDLSSALEQAAADAGMVVCTRSGHDVVLVQGEEEAVVPVDEITPVDATGAGDQFAAGFLMASRRAALSTWRGAWAVSVPPRSSRITARARGGCDGDVQAAGLV